MRDSFSSICELGTRESAEPWVTPACALPISVSSRPLDTWAALQPSTVHAFTPRTKLVMQLQPCTHSRAFCVSTNPGCRPFLDRLCTMPRRPNGWEEVECARECVLGTATTRSRKSQQHSNRRGPVWTCFLRHPPSAWLVSLSASERFPQQSLVASSCSIPLRIHLHR